MLLLHTALACEAKPLIKKFNLIQYNKFDGFKLYKSSDKLLLISGIGKTNTIDKLSFVFENFKIDRAVNTGICGCKNIDIEIGKLYSVLHKYNTIEINTIETFDKPCEDKTLLNSNLVDMEYKYFYEISKKYLNDENIESFKIVSDHLDKKIPNKKFVEEIMDNALTIWSKYIE